MQTYVAYNAYQHFEMNRGGLWIRKKDKWVLFVCLFVFVKPQFIRQVVPAVFICRTVVFSSSKNWVVTFVILRH